MTDMVLLDSNFIYALHDETDHRHQLANTFAISSTLAVVMPDVTLPEVAFLCFRAGGVPNVLKLLDSLVQTNTRLEPLALEDVSRAREIIAAYADAKLDVVDCCIMALAERLNIISVCTFDRRDFSIFRPSHCDYLELLS